MKKIMTVLLALAMLATLMMPVMAAKSDFVPSAEVKPAPGVVEKPTEDGTPAVGVIIMPDGTVIPVPGTAIIITPLEGADTAEPPSIGEDLNDAYDELKSAEDLEELIKDLEEILDQIGEDVDPDDLVINDLIHIYIDEEYEKYLEEGGKLQITFEVTEDILLALKQDGDKWDALFGENWVDNGDGTYTLTISKSGVVAFLKSAASVDVNPDDPGVSSPTTGDFTMLYVVIGSAFAVAAVVFAVVAKKQKA